jgi:hypothetical protein
VLKEEIPAAAHIMVVGSKRKFLTCLITLRTVVSHFALSVLLARDKKPKNALLSKCSALAGYKSAERFEVWEKLEKACFRNPSHFTRYYVGLVHN